MNCLEEKLDLLSQGCQKVVQEYIEEVDEDPGIDEIFVRACSPFWDKHCQVYRLCVMIGEKLSYDRRKINGCMVLHYNLESFHSYYNIVTCHCCSALIWIITQRDKNAVSRMVAVRHSVM